MADSSQSITLEDEIEGEHVDSNEYVFQKIGEPVPIKPDDSSFDPQRSPSGPLAVSEKHGLVFVAHSSGFCVARTKDIMASATEIEGKGKPRSIQELSVVDVPLPRLGIIALSTDDSTLAVTVDANIHFFSVDSLLNKGLKPGFSCSFDESSSIKDMQWTRKPENCYVLLSGVGKLYHGTVGGPLKDVMDGVDAVGWSLKGKSIAVARMDKLSILSSNFNERSSMLLSFKSWTGDSDTNCIVRVDSIRWVRHDSIILGSFQVTADGNEENYLVQVIKLKDGKFTDDACKPVVIPFYDLFRGLIDDILPSSSGPYLMASYLEQCELAIIANRKNVDQHIVYLSWSLGNENNEVVAVDILRDRLIPRIELQENDDDNLILGLCIDKVSISQKIIDRVGEEQREFSPYCILMCLTLEGQLIMFHVASESGIKVPPAIVSTLSDEDEDSPGVVSVESESFNPSQLAKEEVEKVFMDNRKSALVTEKVINKESINSNQKEEPLTNSQPFEADGQGVLTVQKDYPDKNEKQRQLPLLENRTIEQASSDASHQGGPSHVFRDFGRTETQISVGASFAGSIAADTAAKSTSKSLVKMELTGPQAVSSESWSSGNITSSNDTHMKFPLVSSSRSGNTSPLFASTGANEKPFGKLLPSKDISGISTSVNFSDRVVENGGRRPSAFDGNRVPVSSLSASQMVTRESSSSAKSSEVRVPTSKENYSDLPQTRIPISEPKLSKQFGNIKEMTKELDMLLQSIEGAGGFMDACTVDQKRSVEELERGIGTTSNRLQKWKSIMDEQLREIQHLLDITVQVLARRVYMEGIIKQASDSQYLDFWNSQKLSSELELKQRHILKMNQDLTGQLIRLERHFNGLELSKFGQDAGAHAGQRAFQSRSGPSRHIQSLHSLHNTMTSQLAAADQLADCLSKQMTTLKIESPAVKQQNVKKELFETIGIPYDSSFSSPSAGATKVSGTTNEQLLFSLGSAASKDQPRRTASVIKNYEPETARRRRDSLDRSWEDYKPKKATVKRLLLQESGKESINRSSALISKQTFPRQLEESAVTRPRDHASPATFLRPSQHKGIQGTEQKQALWSSETPFAWVKDIRGPLKPTELKSPAMQELKMSSASQVLPAARQNFMRETRMTAEKSGDGITYIQKSESVSMKEQSFFPSDTSEKPPIPMVPAQTPPLLKKPNDMPSSYAKDTLPTKESVKNRPFTTTAAATESGKKHNFSYSPPVSVPVSADQPGKVPQSDAVTNNHLSKVSASPTFSLSVSAPSSPLTSSSSAPLSSLSVQPSVAPTPPSLIASNKSLASSDITSDVSKPISTSSSSSSLTVPSISSFAVDASKPLVPSSALSLVTSSSESPKTETNANTILPSQKFEPSSLMLKPSISSTIRSETPTGPASENQPNLTRASPAAGVVSGTQASSYNTAGPTNSGTTKAEKEQPSTGPSPFPTAFSALGTVIGGRTDGPGVQNVQEDDMDEEAPSSITELSLGSLGGFGLGSAPNPTAPKANPFGEPFGNAATIGTSPFSSTVPSGELFQPASFNVQSLQPANPGAFVGGFGTSNSAPAPSLSGFGQSAQVGPGQQALGSVLGAFGQSRQLGTSLPGTGSGSPGGFGGGVVGTNPIGGYSSPATGGFAGAASGGGGFASLASGGGGFSGAVSGGSGFAGAASSGSGFSGAALGGGFGAFGGQQGSGGFSGFGSAGATGKPPELFTQMRK